LFMAKIVIGTVAEKGKKNEAAARGGEKAS